MLCLNQHQHARCSPLSQLQEAVHLWSSAWEISLVRSTPNNSPVMSLQAYKFNSWVCISCNDRLMVVPSILAISAHNNPYIIALLQVIFTSKTVVGVSSVTLSVLNLWKPCWSYRNMVPLIQFLIFTLNQIWLCPQWLPLALYTFTLWMRICCPHKQQEFGPLYGAISTSWMIEISPSGTCKTTELVSASTKWVVVGEIITYRRLPSTEICPFLS